MALRLCDPLDLYPLEDRNEREKLAIFGVCVPQKQAEITWQKVQGLWAGYNVRPFTALRHHLRARRLWSLCVELRLGQYTRITAAFESLAGCQTDWSWEELEDKIGLKTSRMVGLYSVPSARVAVLDTIVLANLRAMYPKRDIPDSTPASRKKYEEIQKLFLEIADRRKVEPWVLDKQWWTAARFRKKGA